MQQGPLGYDGRVPRAALSALEALEPGAVAAAARAFVGPHALGVLLVEGLGCTPACDDSGGGPSRRTACPECSRLQLLRGLRLLGRAPTAECSAALAGAGLGSDTPRERPSGTPLTATRLLKWRPGAAPDDARSGVPGGECSTAAPAHPAAAAASIVAHETASLGARYVAVCAAVAAACDAALAAVEPAALPRGGLLGGLVLASGTAKARAVLYAAHLGGADADASSAQQAARGVADADAGAWQSWHFDYGLFTAVSAPLYAVACDSPPRELHAVGGGSGAAAAEEEEAAEAQLRTHRPLAGAAETRAPALSRALSRALSGGHAEDAVGRSLLCPGRSEAEDVSARFPLAWPHAGLTVLVVAPDASPDAAAAAAAAAVGDSATAAGAAAAAAAAAAAGAPPPLLAPLHVPPGCVAVQAGEAAQILSGGRIAAAAHCVRRPRGPPLLPLQARRCEPPHPHLPPAWRLCRLRAAALGRGHGCGAPRRGLPRGRARCVARAVRGPRCSRAAAGSAVAHRRDVRRLCARHDRRLLWRGRERAKHTA